MYAPPVCSLGGLLGLEHVRGELVEQAVKPGHTHAPHSDLGQRPLGQLLRVDDHSARRLDRLVVHCVGRVTHGHLPSNQTEPTLRSSDRPLVHPPSWCPTGSCNPG